MTEELLSDRESDKVIMGNPLESPVILTIAAWKDTQGLGIPHKT